MADNDYLDLMKSGPANVVGASGTPAPQAAQAIASPVPSSVAAVDPGKVTDMGTVQNAVAIAKSNPKMAQWSAGDPAHVSASLPHYSWLDGLSQAFDRIKSSLFPGPRPSVGVGEEIGNEFSGAIGSLGAGLKATTDPNATPLSVLSHSQDILGAPGSALGALFSPLTGTLTATAGQLGEHYLGLNREFTGQVLSMLVPLGAKLPKAGEIPKEAAHPIVEMAENNAKVMDAAHSAIQGSELHASSKPTMTEFIKQQVDGTPLETTSINASQAIKAYQDAGYSASGPKPYLEDGILGWVPDIQEKLADAQASGQDLKVPSADYLTNVSEAGHAALRDGLSFGDARSINDSNAIIESAPDEFHLDNKVVDENGNPLTVYHGSPNKGFERFDESKINPNDPDGPYNGFWFSSSFDEADTSGKFPWARPNTPDAETRAFELSIKNPAPRKAIREAQREWETARNEEKLPASDRSMQDGVRRILQEKGYDGIFHQPYSVPNKATFEKTGETKFPGRSSNERLVNNPEGGVDLYNDHIGHVTGYTDFEDAVESLKHGTYVAFKPEQIRFAEAQKTVEATAAVKAVQKVKQEQYLNPLFKDAKAAGMTEPQFKLYSQHIQEADTALYERLIELEAKQAERQQSSNWLEQAALEHPEARDAIASRPGVEARHFLATGEDLNGLGISPVKLDRASVAEAFPDLIKDLPKEIFGPNGVGADDVAEVFGFRNGESMLRAIDDAERVRKNSETISGKSIPVKDHFAELVKNETDRRVAARLGNYLSEESIEKAAREATQAPEVQRLLNDELGALAKQAGLPFDKAAVQSHAEEIFGRTRSADALNLKALERAVGRAGRDAEVALLKGDVPKAFLAKQTQLVANHTLGLAHQYIKEFTSATKKWSKWAKAETVGSVDQSYMNYIHSILATMSYRVARDPAELLESLGGRSLPDFILDNHADGLPIPFEGIAQKTPKDLTVNEFRANRDTLTALAAVGKFVKEIEINGKRMEMAYGLARLSEQRAAIGDKFTAEDLKDTSFRGKLASAWRGANSSLKVMEFLFDKLDGKPDGVFNDVIVRPMQAAKHSFDDMAADLATKFKDFSKTQPKEWDKGLEQKIDVPLDYIDPDGQSVRIVKTKKDLIAAALHWGNSENRYKLVEGFGLKDIDFASAFASHMTKPDWDFVQFYWDSAEDLWNKAREMHRAINGVAPPSVKPEPFDTDFGTYRGGHAPIFYDSLLAKDVTARGGEAGLFGNRFMRALPSKSYTIKRTGYTAPIELDLDMYKGRFDEMMHDVAYRQALLNADKFLSNQTVRNTMMKMIGPEYTDQTKTWLQNIAHAKDYDDKGTAWWNSFVKTARTNMVSVNILYKLSTILKHGPTALAKSIDEVGAESLLSAYKQMTQHPKGWFGALEDAGKESGEMRRRLINNDANFREAFQTILKKQGWLSKIQEYGAYGVSMSDQFSALPTYIAAKNMALEAGKELPDAIAEGEKAVRRAHGASGTEDVAPILASQNPLWRLVTPFMTFMNNGYNRILETGDSLAAGKAAFDEGAYKEATRHFSRATMKTFWNVVMPALIEQAVSGEVNDKKSFLHRFIDSTAGTLSSGIPIARDVVNAATRGSDYALSPVESVVNTALKTGRESIALLEGHKMSPRYIQHMFETVGYFSGLPTGQVGQASNYLYNFSTGKEHPRTLMQFLHGLRTGKGK